MPEGKPSLSPTVLIADPNRERAAQMAEACRDRGLETRSVRHGARALEAALEAPPAVVVAPFDLPLIDAEKLASILRANPKTQGVRFVFLDTGTGARGDFGDELVPLPVDPGEVARRSAEQASRHERIEVVGQASRREHEVAGKLAQISLPDLIQLFHGNRKNGVFELSRSGPAGATERGQIVFRDGQVVQAHAGEVEGEKALFRLLAWEDGSFEFRPDESRVVARIAAPPRQLLLEGMRQVDELRRLRDELPSDDAHVALRVKTSELPHNIHPLTQEVLLLLEIYSRVQDVVDRSSYPDYQVLRTLHTLIERGMVQVRRGSGSAPAAAGDGPFTPVQARRVREWLESGSPGQDAQSAKLVIASPDADVTAEFVRLLRALPGMRLEGSFAGGTFGADDLAPIGRLSVEGPVSLQLWHMPAGDDYAPLWPVVSHGALGVVLLGAGAGPEAVEALGPIERSLQGAPAVRLFHVVLVRKDDESKPGGLRDGVSLLDQGSFFLLPIDGDKDPVSLLRGLLSRLVP